MLDRNRCSVNIENSVALVTGASRGVGLALIEALLARSAARVYAAARNPALLEELVVKYGPRVIPLQMDILDAESVAKSASIASDVNLLINNAGVSASGGLLDTSVDLIRRDMETNFFGTLNVVRSFSPIIERNGGGAILNVLSISALASSPGLGGYSASKAAAFSLTQAIRAQLGGKGIRVYGAFPGPIDTDMAKDIPVQKAEPQDVVRLMLDSMEAGEEDIFPDSMSRQGGATWRKDPKILERQLAFL